MLSRMLSRNNIFVVIVILLILVGGGFVYFKSYNTVITNQTPVSNQVPVFNLENKLLDTAWIQLDPSGGDTDFEIDFRKTKENDPLHKSYDYQDYLHQRPGESGYWKVEDNIITVTAHLSDLPPIIYTNVNIAGNILIMTDSDSLIKFKRIP